MSLINIICIIGIIVFGKASVNEFKKIKREVYKENQYE